MKYFNSFDNLRLAYRDEGTGHALLCLPGLTRNSNDFDYLAPHLDHLRLIRPDYRGRGASDWSNDPSTYSWATEARDVIDLLDHLGIAKIAILGTSRGGMIAMHLAKTTKTRLTGVCLNDIGPEIPRSGLDRIISHVGQQPTAKSHTELASVLQYRAPEFRNVPTGRWLQEAKHRAVKTESGLALTYDPKLRQRLTIPQAGDPADLWPLFDAMEGLPLALVRGKNSDILTRDTANLMRQRRPDMAYAEIPDRGHIPFLDEPIAVATITKWLKECR